MAGQDLAIECACGAVKGMLRGVEPASGNHIVCMCDDCQAYARFLGTDGIVDAHGGTEIFQMPASLVSLTEGQQLVACVRLSSKGMHRWYASCCRTPIANTLGPRVPFAGVIHCAIGAPLAGGDRNDALGPVLERVQGRFAPGGVPEGSRRTASLGLLLRMVGKVAGWWLRGLRGSPFFDSAGKPIVTPQVLTADERDALRALR